MSFQNMGLNKELHRVIQEMNYTEPTPVQERAIPLALEGRDLICCAQTGTGKTAAFAFPILQKLAAEERADLRALVLVPTRELAIQVDRNLCEYGKYLDLVSTTVYGGVPIEPQEMMLRSGVDILVATPGRLIDHMWRGNIDYRHTKYLVLDEADRMLDMGFIDEVSEIVREIPKERQSMLFSATLDQEIRRFSKGILRNPLRIEVSPPASTVDEVDQFLVRVSRRDKRSTLEKLIRRYRMRRAIIFARTKIGASNLASQLKSCGCRASAIHSDRSQDDRVRTLEAFRAGRIHLLVATDIAARGIDVHDISHIVNYDLPFAAGDYVHRIGRTARAGRRGMAISLVTPEDTRSVEAIERLISKKLSWLEDRDSQVSADSKRVHTAGSPARSRRAAFGNGKARPGNGRARSGNAEARPGNGRARLRNGKPRPGNGKALSGNAEARPVNERARPGNGRARLRNGKPRPGNGKARPDTTATDTTAASRDRSLVAARSGQECAGHRPIREREPARRRGRRRTAAGGPEKGIKAPAADRPAGQRPEGLFQTIINRLRTGLAPVLGR